MSSEEQTGTVLEDPKINVRIILSTLWISQFLLWTFGDALSLLQQLHDPISTDLLLFVAVPLALLQIFMVIFNLIGVPKIARLLNIIIAPVFVLFNIGYIADGSEGYEYLLGLGYIMVDALIIWHAWNWPMREASPE